MQYQLKENDKCFYITVIYIRCTALERLELWEDLENMAKHILVPWLVGGDFNLIMDDFEILEGLTVTQQETEDFAGRVSACALNKLRFIGSNYTWWNGRIKIDCIFR